jgi:hypothetical protein
MVLLTCRTLHSSSIVHALAIWDMPLDKCLDQPTNLGGCRRISLECVRENNARQRLAFEPWDAAV